MSEAATSKPGDGETAPSARSPATRSRARRVAFVLGAVGLSIALALGVLEGILRLAGKQPRARDINGYFFVADSRLGWRNRSEGLYENAGFGSTVRTGARGERLGVRSSPDPTGPTVLFVGDSTTFCAEVNDDQTSPSEVAKLLPAERAPFVVNAGVRAYGTLQAVRTAEEWLARAPVKVVVYTYADNDFVETVDPIVYPGTWAPRGRWTAEGKLAIDEPREPATGWGRPIDDAGVLPWDRRLVLDLARRSALAEALRAKLGIQLFFRAQHLEDGAFGPVTQDQWPRAVAWADEHHSTEVIGALLAELDKACAAKGATLLVTRFTDHAGRSGKLEHERFLEAVSRSGVRFVDVGPGFGDDSTVYHPPPVRPGAGQDMHYGRRGTAAYAAALAPRILEALAGR